MDEPDWKEISERYPHANVLHPAKKNVSITRFTLEDLLVAGFIVCLILTVLAFM